MTAGKREKDRDRADDEAVDDGLDNGPDDDPTRLHPGAGSTTRKQDSREPDADDEATRLKESADASTRPRQVTEHPSGRSSEDGDEGHEGEATRVHPSRAGDDGDEGAAEEKTRVHRPDADEQPATVVRTPGDQATEALNTGEQATEALDADGEATEALGPDASGTRVQDDGSRQSSGRDLPSARSRAPEGTIRDTRKHSGAPLAVGSVLRGRFRIEGVLGEGGMGTVFTAVDLLKEEARDDNVHVALKIMKEDIADARLSFMGLQREARRAQQLAHPNIVTVYDFDRADGVIYMTMEYLRGEPLDEVLKKNPHGLENKLARETTIQICRGLAHAHKEGIVHSDLKPQNVFLLENGRAKILDFGIARAYQAKKLDRVEAAFTGYSPAYASPQIFEKKAPKPTDDVFALGCLVYQLFTGKHPFDWISADKAADKGMRPKRHSAFSRAQWATVAAALSFDAARRPKDALDFLKRFAPSYVKRFAFGISAASIAAAVSFVLIFQPTPGPEIPFEELPAELQQQISRNLDDARQFYDHGDLNTALQLYDAVLSAHPGNLDGVEGMNRTVDSVLERVDAGLETGQVRPGDARRSLESVLAYETLPSRSRRVIENRLESL